MKKVSVILAVSMAFLFLSSCASSKKRGGSGFMSGCHGYPCASRSGMISRAFGG